MLLPGHDWFLLDRAWGVNAFFLTEDPVAVAKEESVEALPDPLRSLPGNGYNGTGSLWIGALTPFIYYWDIDAENHLAGRSSSPPFVQ